MEGQPKQQYPERQGTSDLEKFSLEITRKENGIEITIKFYYRGEEFTYTLATKLSLNNKEISETTIQKAFKQAIETMSPDIAERTEYVIRQLISLLGQVEREESKEQKPEPTLKQQLLDINELEKILDRASKSSALKEESKGAISDLISRLRKDSEPSISPEDREKISEMVSILKIFLSFADVNFENSHQLSNAFNLIVNSEISSEVNLINLLINIIGKDEIESQVNSILSSKVKDQQTLESIKNKVHEFIYGKSDEKKEEKPVAMLITTIKNAFSNRDLIINSTIFNQYISPLVAAIANEIVVKIQGSKTKLESLKEFVSRKLIEYVEKSPSKDQSNR